MRQTRVAIGLKRLFAKSKWQTREGDDRDNSDSRAKLELGNKWAACAGGLYRYFMVFSNQEMEGAVKRAEFNLRLSSL